MDKLKVLLKTVTLYSQRFFSFLFRTKSCKMQMLNEIPIFPLWKSRKILIAVIELKLIEIDKNLVSHI